MTLALAPVESSNIKAVGYDAPSRTMRVQFKSGAMHDYADVPPEKHSAMLGADSIGGYFHANVKSAHKSTPVEDP